MHSLLERQLKKYFGSLENIPNEWKAFLKEVSISYQEADQERSILENVITEMEKSRHASSQRISAGYRYQSNNIIEADTKPSSETQRAREQGKTVLRKKNKKDTNGGSRIAVPIKLREQTLGVLDLSFENAETAQQNASLLEQLSARLALAMDNARLFAETQISLARTNALLKVSRAAIAFEDIPDLLQTLVDNIAKTLPADRVSLTTFDLSQKQITSFYAGGPGIAQVVGTVTFDEFVDGLNGWVIKEKKPALSPKNIPDPRERAELQQRRRETNCGSVLVVPLIYRGQVIGTLTAINTPEQPDFTEQDVELLVAMASQGATAIENARLFQVHQRRAAELQAAAEVSRAASSILELDKLLEQTVEVIRERFGLYYVGLFLVDSSGDWAELRAGTGEAGRIQIERQHKLRVGGESMIGQCIATSAARISQDVGEEALRFKNPVLPETRSEMALPLMSRGVTIGAMTIQSVMPAAFSQESITTLQTMADQLANAIQNAQLFAQTEARATELAVLNGMARTLAETLDVDSIIEQVYQFASRLIDTENFYLALYYPELNEIEFKLYTVDGKRVTVQDQRRRAGRGLTEHVIRTRRPLFIEENVDEYIRNLTGVEAIGRSSHCWLGIPMIAGNQVVGVINVQHYTTPFYFTQRDQQLLTAVAGQAAVAIQNGRLFEQTQRQNQDLSVLSEMGSVLNAILDRETILEKTYEFTSRLLDFTSFVIAFHHPDQEEISIPFAVENGQRLGPQRLPHHSRLVGYVIRSKTSLFLPENVMARAKELGINAQVSHTKGESALSWVGVPIQAGATVLGVLSVQSTTPQTMYTERHRDLLISIANLVANALENARLFEQTQLQNQELAVLNEMGRALNALLDKEKIIESIHEYTTQLVDFTSFVVALYNNEKDEISFPLAVENGKRLPISPVIGTNNLIGFVIQTKAPLLIPENLEARVAELGISMRTIGEEAKSWLAAPILIGQTVIGAISVQSISTPRLYTERHQGIMISISNLAATALQNATLFEQAQRQNEVLAVLNKMSRVLTNLLAVDSILEQIYNYTTRLIRTLDFFMAFYDEESREVSFPFVIDEGARIEVPTRPLGNSLTDYVIRKERPLLLKEIKDETITSLGIDKILIGAEAQSWLGVPMRIGQKIAGVLGVQSTDQPNAYSEQDQDLLSAIASQAGIAIQNARSFEQITHRSEDLVTLNEMGRVLSNILDVDQILEQVYAFSSGLFDTTTFIIALYNPEQDELSFTLTVTNGERMHPRVRPLGNGLIDYVIRSQQPLLITDNVSKRSEDLGIEHDYFGDDRPAQCWLGVPITLGERIIGAISIQSLTTPRLYTAYHRNLLISIASQTAITLQNAELFQQTQNALFESTEQARRLSVLNQMSAQLTQADNLDEIFSQAVVYISQIYKADRVSLSMIVPDDQVEIRATYGEQPEYQLGERITIHGTANETAIIENRIVVIPDTLQSAPGSIRSFMVAPISVEGYVIGALNVGSFQPNEYNNLDESLLQQAVSLLGALIANRQLFEIAEQRAQEAQQRSEELAIVNRVVSRVAEAFDLIEGLNIVAHELGQAIGVGWVRVSLMNQEETALNVVAEFRSDLDNPSAIGLEIPVEGNPSTQQVLETKKSLFIRDAQNDPIVEPLHESFRERGILSLVILPLLARGRVLGIIGLDILEKGQVFTKDALQLAESIILQASNAIYNAQLYEQTQKALAETATLYQASAELNGVQNYNDILGVLQKYTFLGHDHTCTVSLNVFEHPWTSEQMPEFLIPLAQWNRDLSSSPPLSRIPLSERPNIRELFNAENVTFVENTEADPRTADDTVSAVHQQIKHAKSMVFAPLVVARTWIGHVIGIYDQVTSVSPPDIRRLTALAQQATVALQNLRLLAESQRRASQLLTAAEIARSASETLAQEELLFRAVNLIRDRFGFYHASVYLLDDSRQWAIVSESTGEAGAEMKRIAHQLEVGSQSVVGTVTITGNPLIVNDVTKDGVHRPNLLLPDTKAELGIPLKIGRRIIGALDVQSTETDAFTPDDVAVLQILADQIAIAVDNSRSYAIAQDAVKDSSDRLEEISTLFEISQSLSSAPLLTEQIGEIIASRIIRVLGGSASCRIPIYNTATEMMQMLVDITYENGKNVLTERPEKWEFRLSDFPARAKVMQTLEPIIVQADDPNAEPNELQHLTQVGAETLLILPLAIKGEAFGLIEVESWGKKKLYTPDQINLALTVANQGAAAMENARLYEEQIKTAEQLREVDKLKNQFLANMSHELRTPLNSIIGFSRVILKGIDGPVTDLQEQDLTAIYNAGTHLLGLINDILDISRIEAGKMNLSFEQVDLVNLITSVMSTAKGLVKERSVRLETYFEPNLPHIKADPTRLRQVILNLLQNASKFTEEGTISVKAVSQVNARGKQEVMISVSDTGTGIAPENQERLFEPFIQVDASPTRKAGGSGLGLSITRNLIELHGGQIDLISDVGKGSTFFFTIPAVPATGSLAAQEGEIPKEQSGENRKLILAIEDDEQIIQLYKRYLEPEGYQVIPLTDSTIAVKQAKVIQPFAITLDVHMPNLDGWQVIKALKSNPETRHIPVIFCTIVENQAKGYSLGAADYLMKPILGEDLINALQRLERNTEIKHILVIDDDPDDLRLVEKALQLSGTYQVRLAQGGQKGLDAMRKNKPDAVILDLSMPDVDGFEVLEIMRADRYLKGIPVIILTALDLDVDQQKLLSEYTQDQLRKGFLDEDGLLACLQQVLRRTTLTKSSQKPTIY